MVRFSRRGVSALWVAGLIVGATTPTLAADPGLSFQRDVLPLLRTHCQGCHQPARLEGGVDLTTSAGILGVGESGTPIVAPGDPDESELLAQVTPDEQGVAMMPKQGKPLSANELALLRRWIAEGATIDADHSSPSYDQEHPPVYTRPATISAIDVSPDGALIAISGSNETLLLDAHAAAAGERVVVRRLIGRAERIESVRFSPDGTRLAVAGGQPGIWGELQIWNSASGDLVMSRAATGDVLRGLAWSPDGSRVAFGGADTNLYVVDAATGEQLLEQGAHADWVLASAFSADGQFVVSGSRDQTLKLVEVKEGRFVDNVTGVSPGVPGGMIFALARHPHFDLVAVGGSEGVPRTYLIHREVERKIGDDSNLVRAYPAMPGRLFAMAFSPDGTRLAAAGSDGQNGRVDLFAVPDAIHAPDDIKLIQGKVSTERSADESARLADYHRIGAVQLASLAAGIGPAYAMAFMPDGKKLAVGGGDGILRLVDAVHGTVAAELVPFPFERETQPSRSLAHSDEKSTEGGDAGTLAVTSADDPHQVEANEHNGVSSARVEFLTDVMPILAKVGCNSGACHGAREGKNGFALSLRGYDPGSDFRALTDDYAGRRVNRARAEASLMLLKPSGGVPHGGGVVLEPGSRRYDIVRRWIEQGAEFNAEAPRVAAIEISPLLPVVERPGESVVVQVTARYTDGSQRDVTDDAFIESGDTEVATADAGVLTALRRGEAPLLARYEGAYAATILTVMGDRTGFEATTPPVYNAIDELVDSKLARMKIAASPLCTDEEFLRRVTLDLTGLQPTADQVREFAADGRPSRDKRRSAIERLIGSDDYIEHWTNRWADLLLVNSKFLAADGAAAYRAWIRTAVAENWPYDRFVRELFTATGSNREHPAASYYKALRTPDALAETATQVFLGVRFSCNKCHDHPFERWTVNDYYGWAACFKDVHLEADPASGDRKIEGTAVESTRALYEIVTDRAGGEVLHVRTGRPTAPRLPFPVDGIPGEEPVLRRRAAAWLTSPKNRYFASSFVNRVWAHLTGVGLIEPIDDIRASNPPTNPELLDWLTREFIAHDFDMQWLIRTICESRTYQLSSETTRWNADDRRNYSHALPRRLPAEVLYDSVQRAVGSSIELPGVPLGTRAAALPDASLDVESGLLAKLGRPARESGCECERTNDLQLGPVMALVNGPTFAAAIDDPRSALAQLVASTSDDRALVEEVYLRILNRKPTSRELGAGIEILAAPSDDRPAIVQELAARAAELEPGFEPWRRANRPIAWAPLLPNEVTGSMGSAFKVLDDGSILVEHATGKGVYRIVADVQLPMLRGLRLEVIADDRLPSRGPGRAPNGNFVLSQMRVSVSPSDKSGAVRRLKFRSAEADFSQPTYDAAGAIDARPETGWAVHGGAGQSHAAAFALSRPLACGDGSRLVIELDQQYDDEHLLGRFRISATADEPPFLRHESPTEVQSLLATAPGELTPAQLDQLRAYYWSLDAKYAELKHAESMLADPRLSAVQDLAWALINSPAFLFNH